MRIEDVFTEPAPFEQAFAEALFRDVEDYDRGFNCVALALFITDSSGGIRNELRFALCHKKSSL